MNSGNKIFEHLYGARNIHELSEKQIKDFASMDSRLLRRLDTILIVEAGQMILPGFEFVLGGQWSPKGARLGR